MTMLLFTSNVKSNETFSNIFTNNYACLASHSNSYLLPVAIHFVNFEVCIKVNKDCVTN